MKFAVKIRIWRVNQLDNLEVKAQAENTKKSTSWSLRKVEKLCEEKKLNVGLNFVAK